MSIAKSPTEPAREDAKAMDFNAATQRLEEIIALMDDPDTSLESMISLAEEGTQISRNCASVLEQAELRIKQLEAPPASVPHSDTSSPQDHDFTLL